MMASGEADADIWGWADRRDNVATGGSVESGSSGRQPPRLEQPLPPGSAKPISTTSSTYHDSLQQKIWDATIETSISPQADVRGSGQPPPLIDLIDVDGVANHDIGLGSHVQDHDEDDFNDDDGEESIEDDNDALSADTLGRVTPSVSLVDTSDHGDRDSRSEIDLLQRRIAELQAQNDTLHAGIQPSVKASPWPVLYRITCLHNQRSATYLDHPVLIDDNTTDHVHVDSQRRIPSEQDWEKTQRSAPFVVYKTYTCQTRLSYHKEEQLSQQHDPKLKSKRRKRAPKVQEEEVHILSESLQLVVDSMFQRNPGLEVYWKDEDEDMSVLCSPYVWLFQFEDYVKGFAKTLSTDRDAFELLLRYMLEQSSTTFSKARDLFNRGFVTSDLMPYLFSPTELLVFEEGNQVIAGTQLTLVDINTDTRFDVWDCFLATTTFDGKFQSYTKSVRIPIARPGEGVRPTRIMDLLVYPLKYAPHGLEQELLNRGRNFFEYSKGRYVNSITIESKLGKDTFDMRYMVDVEAYHIYHASKDEKSRRVDAPFEADESDPNFFLQLPASIEGFRMSDKEWKNLRICDIRPVEWNKHAFEDLVIDPDSKLLIQALVRNKIELDKGIDFIEGKGTGLVVLLHGGPGTGKTLTAESVAEIAEKPLYRVTCGDIGTNPTDVERYLESVFLLGRRWGCVVLLDEADVFLEERSIDNLERNALVSVFLRAIEYYDGILMLTSNRVGKFDEAFKSRIQLALRYKPLTDPQRRQIWMNFIQRLKDVKEDMDLEDIERHIDDLANGSQNGHMNGRQIRNAVNTARQLARFRAAPLNHEHLKHVIKISKQFDEYVDEIREGINDEDMARERRDR